MAQVIEHAMDDLRLTQSEVATRARQAGFALTQTQVSRILNGSVPLKVEDAQAIAAVLGMRLSALVVLAESDGDRPRPSESVTLGSTPVPTGGRRRRSRRGTAETPSA